MTKKSPVSEPVRKELTLACPREHAFDVFARRMNEWWPSARHSVSGDEVARVDLEGRVGGRVFETRRDGQQVDWGRVVRWQPPELLAFTWHPGADTSQATTVTVTFREQDDETTVCLEHVGWDVYGEGADAKRDNYDRGWSKVLDVWAALINSGGISMHKAAKLPMLVLTSGALTLFLFRLMAAMVAVGNTAWAEPPKTAPVEVAPVRTDTPPKVITRKLPERHTPERPPSDPGIKNVNRVVPPTTIKKVNVPMGGENIGFGGPPPPIATQNDGEEVPIFRVEPTYPRHAAAHGIEGWVVVRFDVSASGATENIRIVDAQPRRTFARAAIRAVSKWKYSPKVVGGERRVKKNLQVRLTFRIQ